MSFSDVIKRASDLLQRPQSITTSMIGEVTGQYDDDRQFVHQYESALVPDTPENAARYERAWHNVGNSESQTGNGVNALLNPAALVSAAARGATHNLRPSQLSSTSDDSVGQKAGNTAMDILFDPMLAAGVGKGMFKAGLEHPALAGEAATAGKGLLSGILPEGGKLARMAQGAGTFGKIENPNLPEGLGKLASLTQGVKGTLPEHVGQLGRQFYQASMAGADSPMAFLQIMGGMGTAENLGSRVLPKIASKLLAEGINPETLTKSESALGKNIDDALGETAMQKAAREANDLTGQIGTANNDAMRTAAMKAQGVPQDPTGASAMALQDVMDKLDNFKASQIGQPELNAGPPIIAQGPPTSADPLALPVGNVQAASVPVGYDPGNHFSAATRNMEGPGGGQAEAGGLMRRAPYAGPQQLSQPGLPAGPPSPLELGPGRPLAPSMAPTGQPAELNSMLMKLLQDPQSRANLLLTLQNQRPLAFPGR